MHKNVFLTPVASSIPFDNSTNSLVSTNVQSAVEEVRSFSQQIASPGFTWGRSGNVPKNTYLLNDSVPSNTTGRLVPFTGAIEKVFVSNELAGSFTLEIQKRVGNSFTTIASITLTNERTKVVALTGVLVNALDELATMVSNGSCKNIVVGVIVKG